jgi:hypothetical protein
MRVIVPCAGRSSRYPGQPPKWMLPAHDGVPMLRLAVAGLEIGLDQIIVTILREHEERFAATAGIRAAFNHPIQVVVLEEPTRNQPETVAETIRRASVRGPFLVKDSDNCFTLHDVEASHNYVCVESLNNFDEINPRNKSYARVDHNDTITAFREKSVISDLFSVGGYFFLSADEYMDYFGRLERNLNEWHSEMYLSDVISAMILDAIPARVRRVSGYQDWGTIREWRAALARRRAYFVLLDGFVFAQGSKFFTPRFTEAPANPQAVASLRAVANEGHTIIYLSIRPASLAAETEAQMIAAELPPGPVVYDCPLAKWRLVTAPHGWFPFGTGEALEIDPDAPDVGDKMGR